jgi:hypothetical protein
MVKKQSKGPLIWLGFLAEFSAQGEESDVFSVWNYPFRGTSLFQTGYILEKRTDLAGVIWLSY